ncbi:MAG: bifunctional hydroxymethylpyrimidine kinase/phosphomethylpyrimidine kinase [Tissierella sp.]|uniref:bifunctional hydroxymethylpyrimidine kinase/phosphomethylpyrimidine kinase n=1 Tax=Tissierella sp. TaxID=41274 RepID=UPI003F9826A0
MKKILTIAGSDCSGGAGVQADLKTFAAHKTYGMSVITSLTAQNTMGVTDVADLSPEFIGKQMDAVFEDIYPDAIKIGMISNEYIVKMIVKKLKEYDAKNIVIDPVMVATSGSVLMDSKAIDTLKEELLPLASIITPNMKEAGVLSGINVHTKEDMERAAKIIGESIDGVVLVKGGHLDESADDVLYLDGKVDWIKGDRVENPNTHGTGCTLSSAIAANLAKGMNVKEAFVEAKEYLTGAIKDGLDLGKGRGPLNHLY